MSYELRASGCEFLLRNFSPQRHRGTEKYKIILLCGSVTPWCEYLSRLLCFVDPLPSHHRLEHFHISNFRGVDLKMSSLRRRRLESVPGPKFFTTETQRHREIQNNSSL